MSAHSKLLIATTNTHKARELATMMGDLPFTITTLPEEGITLDVDETGTTFEENATLKARTYARLSGLLTMADDSGIKVDALGGQPGIYSARYAGPGASDEDRVQLLLRNMKNVPEDQRQGRFRCVIAVCSPDDSVETFHGTVEGTVSYEPRGENGFGYDPIFFLPERGCTMAELSPRDKDMISHRGQAARKAAEWLRGIASR